MLTKRTNDVNETHITKMFFFNGDVFFIDIQNDTYELSSTSTD